MNRSRTVRWNRLWVGGMMLLTLTGAALAQGLSQGTREAAGSAAEVSRQAFEMAKGARWSGAATVRLELIQREAGLLQSGQGDLDRYLRFFSVTRQVFWNSAPAPALGAKFRELEAASQRLANTAGRNLDLPPIQGLPAASVNDTSPPLNSALPAVQGNLRDSSRKAESLAQSIWSDVRNQALPQVQDGGWAQRARQDLVGLAENLQNLRIALEEGSDPSQRLESLNVARIRFLTSYRYLPPLDGRLQQLLDSLQDIGELSRAR